MSALAMARALARELEIAARRHRVDELKRAGQDNGAGYTARLKNLYNPSVGSSTLDYCYMVHRRSKPFLFLKRAEPRIGSNERLCLKSP